LANEPTLFPVGTAVANSLFVLFSLAKNFGFSSPLFWLVVDVAVFFWKDLLSLSLLPLRIL